MNGKHKKIITVAIALLVMALGAAGVYGILNLNKLSAERAVESGIKAESVGDTKKALAEYKKAGELCAPKDDRCRIDMEMKVSLLNDALKNEQAGKVGEPVSGPSSTPPVEELAPDDTNLVENE